MNRRFTALAAFVLLLIAPAGALAQGQIIIVNADGPNEGFNDPTPAPTVGGNPGTTLGAQRLFVFNRAADIWRAALQPRVDIVVLASFDPLAPNVAGSAGATFVFSNFTGNS